MPSDELMERAERLMRYAAKTLAFPEKLTPQMKSAFEDIYEVSRGYLNKSTRDEAASLKAALAEIAEMTSRRQLPLTSQINDVANTALGIEVTAT